MRVADERVPKTPRKLLTPVAVPDSAVSGERPRQPAPESEAFSTQSTERRALRPPNVSGERQVAPAEPLSVAAAQRPKAPNRPGEEIDEELTQPSAKAPQRVRMSLR